MINFRQYQTDAIGSIYGYFEQSTGNPIVAMPTGTETAIDVSNVGTTAGEYKLNELQAAADMATKNKRRASVTAGTS